MTADRPSADAARAARRASGLRRTIRQLDRRFAAILRALDAAAWRQAAALAVLCAAMFLPGIAALPVTDRDEARFVQASRQMLETGDFIDIRFQDEPRWKKPAGIYWMQAGAAAAAAAVSGRPVERIGVWAYRLPSALGATLAVLGLFAGLAPLIGRAASFRAAAMTATALIVAAEANIAKTDAMLLGLVVLSMGAYLRALRDPGRRGAGLAMWAALAVGATLKGPIVLIPIAGCVAWLCVAERRLGPLKAMGWRLGPALFAAIAAPWYLAIHVKTGGAFFQEAVVEDLFGKVAAGKEAHGAPPGTYLGALWAIFWPWAPLLIPAAPWLWRARARPEMRFLLGWALPMWLMFELIPTKLPHYVMPALPALAAMLALWLRDRRTVPAPRPAAVGLPHDIAPSPPPRRRRRPVRLRRWSLRLAAALFALVGGALGLAAPLIPLALDGAVSPGAILLGAGGLAATAIGAAALSARRLRVFGGAATAASALLCAATLQFALPATPTLFPSPRMAAASAPFAACAGAPAATVTFKEPSLVFAQGTGTALLDHDEAAARILTAPGALVWVEDRRRDRFDAALRAAGGDPSALVELARVDAFNVNRGKATTIRLLARRDDPVWASCPAAAAAIGADAGGGS